MKNTDILAADLLEACRRRNWTLSIAESCTGGLVSAAITAVAGASDVFDRGFVTYSNPAKSDLLGVQAGTLAEFGAVSNQVALEMANGALAASSANLALAITGVAGPGAYGGKPEGRVCFAVAVRGGENRAEKQEYGALGRAEVRAASVNTALLLGLVAAEE